MWNVRKVSLISKYVIHLFADSDHICYMDMTSVTTE